MNHIYSLLFFFMIHQLSFYIIPVTQGDIKEMKKTVLTKSKKSKKGFSLLELLLVLSIIAALIVSAFVVYPKVQIMYRVDKIGRVILGAKSAIQELYKGRAEYDRGISSNEVIRIAFPDNVFRVKGTSLPQNDYGGTYSISGQFASTLGSYSGFSIDIRSVPSGDCIRLVSNIHGAFQSVSINAVTVFSSNTNVPYNPSVVMEACNKYETATIQFTSLM